MFYALFLERVEISRDSALPNAHSIRDNRLMYLSTDMETNPTTISYLNCSLDMRILSWVKKK